MHKALFIVNPWEKLDLTDDSSLHLMEFATAHLGVRCWITYPGEIRYERGSLFCKAILMHNTEEGSRRSDETKDLSLAEFQSIHWRVDPPVYLDTFRLWSLIDSWHQGLLAAKKRAPRMANPIPTLLTWNEKFTSLRFPRHAIPGTAVAQKFKHLDPKALDSAKHILKPTGDASSRGVRFTRPHSTVANKTAFDEVVEAGGAWAVAQPFQEDIKTHGEVRFFILGGKTAAVVRKTFPKRIAAQEFPVFDPDAPTADKPVLEIFKPTAKQRAIAREVEKALKKEKVVLASLDFIGGPKPRMMEINVTSVGFLFWYDRKVAQKSKDWPLARLYWRSVL